MKLWLRKKNWKEIQKFKSSNWKYIINQKRWLLETNQFLPTKCQYGHIKALQIRLAKPPNIEQMPNKWKNYYKNMILLVIKHQDTKTYWSIMT